ncbi:uncharacterized protein EDB91DRAFT_804393 [Suillus paluster]|uniref:uncharacterized protein n=1 Tax=Suillus paluster TaxID=48578 RepID=UPI001B86E9B5|nr:uncharacterized protein EDB91DRAFT_804393 [Suillus paluster]KAG1729876.1 hypothetical protein EDB91DRAFT_804393 [Suillus paluster]
MRDLQAAFETPPQYGKYLHGRKERFTTHDVASVFLRYSTQMPISDIRCFMLCLLMLHSGTCNTTRYVSRFPGHLEHAEKKPFNHDEAIETYKRLIQRTNQCLLLYVLDLLSVFARKSEKNLETATEHRAGSR